MALPATPIVKINLTGGASTFGTPFVLGTSKLGEAELAGAIPNIVDVSTQVTRISTRRERNLLQDKFIAASATVRIVDPNGWWNPQNTSSPYYPNLVPLRKIQIQANYGGTLYDIFSGYITDYNYTYPKDQEIGYVDLTCTDAFRLLFNSGIDVVPDAVAGEGTGTRVGKILNLVKWNTSARVIAAGNTTCQADPSGERTALAAIQTLEFTEQGAFYIDKGGKAVFMSRQQVFNSLSRTPTVFSNVAGSGAINYFNIVLAHDDKTLANEAVITRIGGVAQTYSDINSINAFFTRSISAPNLLMETDTNAANLAYAYVQTRKDVTVRIDAITLDLVTLGYGAGVTAALALDYFDRMQITNTAQTGVTLTKTLQCLGINHDITPNTWNTTFVTQEPILDVMY
jgi:hypothetical protein